MPGSRFWRRRWQTWRVIASAFFLALVGLAVLEIRLSFPDSIDDNAIPFPFFFFFSFFLLPLFYCFIQNTYMFPITLIWHMFATVWVCNYDATLCYYFYYRYDIVLILRTFSLHIHENTLQFLSCDIITWRKKNKGNIKAFSKTKERDNHITFFPRHNNVSTTSHWWDPLSLYHPFELDGNTYFDVLPLSQGVLPTSVQT